MDTDNSNVTIEGNVLQVKMSGRFKVTIDINGTKDAYEFFAWNAFLKSGKYWTYTGAGRGKKSEILHSKVYLSLSKEGSSFKVEDYVFNGGSYSGKLIGKYLTSYYNAKNQKSTSKHYTYAMDYEPSASEANPSTTDTSDLPSTDTTKTDLPSTDVSKTDSSVTDSTDTSKSTQTSETKQTEVSQTQQLEELSFTNLTNKIKNVYIVKVGSEVKIENKDAVISLVDNASIDVKDNTMKINASGRFKVTISINGTSKDYEFFAWNAYLKNGKYWTYTKAGRGEKSEVLHSKVYLSLSKEGSSFKVEDNVFNGGKYSGKLIGKYLTSYYDSKKNTSTTQNYTYSFGEKATAIQLPEINVEKIEIQESVIIAEGDSFVLATKITPSDSTNKDVIWASSDETIAKVDGKGKVTAIKQGVAIITATSSNEKTAQCTVTVCEKTVIVKAEKVVLDKTSATIDVVSGKYSGDEYKLRLNATIEPANTTDKSITWTSSNLKVAKVEDGVVTPVSKGTVKITASTTNGKKATCTIKINNIIPPKVATISLNVANRELVVGNNLTINAEVLPTNAVNKGLVWGSSDTNIATVDGNGVVIGKNPGRVTITAKNIESGIEAKAIINVISQEEATTSTEKLEVHFISAGRVDAIYMKIGDKSLFFDGGCEWNATGSIIPYLNKIGVTHIDYYVGTHGHKDHVEAGPVLIEKYGITTIICSTNKYNGKISTLSRIKAFCETKAQKEAVNKCEVITIGEGDTFSIYDLDFICIGPIGYNNVNPTSHSSGKENGNSLVLRLEYAGYSMLLTGDNSITSNWKKIAKKYPDLVKADIYKNPHHNANTISIINMVQPKYVVFLTHSSYLPSSKVLQSIKNIGAKYYIGVPKKDGNIILTIDRDNGIVFKTKQ